MATPIQPTNIFNDGKNKALKAIITKADDKHTYKAVEEFITANRAWYQGYCKFRTKQGLPYASKNEIIWQVIDMTNPEDSVEFEA